MSQSSCLPPTYSMHWTFFHDESRLLALRSHSTSAPKCNRSTESMNQTGLLKLLMGELELKISASCANTVKGSYVAHLPSYLAQCAMGRYADFGAQPAAAPCGDMRRHAAPTFYDFFLAAGKSRTIGALLWNPASKSAVRRKRRSHHLKPHDK